MSKTTEKLKLKPSDKESYEYLQYLVSKGEAKGFESFEGTTEDDLRAIMSKIAKRKEEQKSWNIVEAVEEMMELPYLVNEYGGGKRSIHEDAISQILMNNGFLHINFENLFNDDVSEETAEGKDGDDEEETKVVTPTGKKPNKRSLPQTPEESKQRGLSNRLSLSRGDGGFVEERFEQLSIVTGWPCGTFVTQAFGKNGWPDIIIKVHPKFYLLIEAKTVGGGGDKKKNIFTPKFNSGMHLGILYIFSSRSGYPVEDLTFNDIEDDPPKFFNTHIRKNNSEFFPFKTTTKGKKGSLIDKNNGGPIVYERPGDRFYQSRKDRGIEPHVGQKGSGGSTQLIPAPGGTTIFLGDDIINIQLKQLQEEFIKKIDELKRNAKESDWGAGAGNMYGYGPEPRNVFEVKGNFFSPAVMFPGDDGTEWTKVKTKGGIRWDEKDHQLAILKKSMELRKSKEDNALNYVKEKSWKNGGDANTIMADKDAWNNSQNFVWNDMDCGKSVLSVTGNTVAKNLGMTLDTYRQSVATSGLGGADGDDDLKGLLDVAGLTVDAVPDDVNDIMDYVRQSAIKQKSTGEKTSIKNQRARRRVEFGAKPDPPATQRKQKPRVKSPFPSSSSSSSSSLSNKKELSSSGDALESLFTRDTPHRLSRRQQELDPQYGQMSAEKKKEKKDSLDKQMAATKSSRTPATYQSDRTMQDSRRVGSLISPGKKQQEKGGYRKRKKRTRRKRKRKKKGKKTKRRR